MLDTFSNNLLVVQEIGEKKLRCINWTGQTLYLSNWIQMMVFVPVQKKEKSHFFVFSVFSCKTLMEPASCCPRNKSSGQCSTLCLCRSWLTHEESEKSILSQKIVASVFWTLEDSGKGIFWRGIDFPGPWKVRILRSCVVELRVLQNPPATEFYFWLLKGGYFRVDQHGLAYLQISCCLDYKLVDTF